jgi:hypothetical protein|tara:strand:+ start:1130 stop:1261 length:132 start_codon:yes stop_codon:yes gene_type:complete
MSRLLNSQLKDRLTAQDASYKEKFECFVELIKRKMAGENTKND